MEAKLQNISNITECMIETMHALRAWRELCERSKKEGERQAFHKSELEKLKQPEDNMKIMAHKFCVRIGELNDDIRQVVDALEHNVVLQAVAIRDIVRGETYKDFILSLHDVWADGMKILYYAGLKSAYRVPPPPKLQHLDLSYTDRHEFFADNFVFAKRLTSSGTVEEVIADLNDIPKTISLMYTLVLRILRPSKEEPIVYDEFH